ncbi:TetR/AcrR family transcriptional regulator [Tuberibacillus sp. Marseille-P3662]|uniref:TetR/AcrR family transcriptional regulator n=1 Tax=Tuberibacillus sp. Marseille-P3662 TaxID=1965358 RepID=UPI000A1CD8A9|nr:TetR/AcrR family transcriptional regulator [Tuberibacillus sp. Marseille-P3662]
MSGLRERKKAKTREAILRSAKRLFMSQGFMNTAMSDIAFDCEVGVGTLYNYYKSKSKLLQEILRNDLPDLSHQIEEIQRNDLLSLSEKLHRIISLSMGVFHQFPRSFYRELFAVISNETESGDVLNRMLDIDKQFIALVADMLKREKGVGRLPDSYPVDTSVDLMYSVLVTQIMMYLFDDRVSEEQILSKIMVQINFLLEQPKS